MYRDGQESNNEVYNKYFLPNGKITESALKTHGLDIDTLKQKGAKRFTLDDCQELVGFLNKERGFPIVAHNLEYDKD